MVLGLNCELRAEFPASFTVQGAGTSSGNASKTRVLLGFFRFAVIVPQCNFCWGGLVTAEWLEAEG